MEKAMVLWKKKLWDYTDNYGNLIYEHKNMEDYKKLRNSDLYWEKKLWKYTKTIVVIALEL